MKPAKSFALLAFALLGCAGAPPPSRAPSSPIDASKESLPPPPPPPSMQPNAPALGAAVEGRAPEPDADDDALEVTGSLRSEASKGKHDLAEAPRAEPPKRGENGSERASSKPRGATVVANISPEDIKHTVGLSLAGIRDCYKAGLHRDPQLQGKVSVRFTVGNEGSVSSAVESGTSTLADAEVVGCVVHAFSSMRFPKPDGGRAVVTYGMQLSPGDL